MTDPLWDLDRVPWRSLRTSGGYDGERVRALLEALWAEPDTDSLALPDELADQVWVSGLLFEAAEPAAEFLMSMLAASNSDSKTLGILTILEYLAYAENHHSEIEAGNSDLEDRVRGTLLSGASVLYALIGSSNLAVRGQAILTLAPLAGPSARFLSAIDHLADATDPLTREALKTVDDYFHDR